MFHLKLIITFLTLYNISVSIQPNSTPYWSSDQREQLRDRLNHVCSDIHFQGCLFEGNLDLSGLVVDLKRPPKSIDRSVQTWSDVEGRPELGITLTISQSFVPLLDLCFWSISMSISLFEYSQKSTHESLRQTRCSIFLYVITIVMHYWIVYKLVNHWSRSFLA